MRKQAQRDLLELIHLVPREKQDATAMLLGEIIFLRSSLTKLKAQIRRGTDNESIKNYDIFCKRYSALIKQVTELIPKTATGETHNALKAFNTPI